MMRVDWFAVLADLNRAGIRGNSLDAIAGISRQKVTRMKEGSEPRFDDGERLLKLWSQITGNRIESAPKMRKEDELKTLSVSRARVLTK